MLECIICGKIIIMNNKPLRYGVCSSCNVMDLTKEQKKIIKNNQNLKN